MNLRYTDPIRYQQTRVDSAALMRLLDSDLSEEDRMATTNMLMQVALYMIESPRSVCLVCDLIPAENWNGLMLGGDHCPEHLETFHTACEAPYFCCTVPRYNPDDNYEWRPANQPQE